MLAKPEMVPDLLVGSSVMGKALRGGWGGVGKPFAESFSEA